MKFDFKSRKIVAKTLILILDSSAFLARNNFGPMSVGETRKFRIDETKPNCQFPKIEITVKKSIRKGFRGFEVVGYEEDAKVWCTPGYVRQLSAEGLTENCGIGKILMKLCFNELVIHDVNGVKENEGWDFFQGWIEDCRAEKKCKDHDHYGRLVSLEKWVKSECSKLVGLFMSAKPKSHAHVYFKSALESDFSEMFIKTGLDEMYPRDDCRSVEVAQDRYTEDGKIVYKFNDVRVTMDVYKKLWWFCLPKKKTTHPNCENL